MRISAFLLAGLTVAQEYYTDEAPQYGDYYGGENYADNYYAAEATTSARPAVGTVEPVEVTEAPTEAPTVAVTDAVTEASTEASTESFLAMDAVEIAPEEVEEAEESAFDPRMSNPFAGARNAVVYVSNINNMDAELQANGDIVLSWDYDATHDAYIFDYVTIIGNSENTTDYQTLAGVSIGLSQDNTKTEATFTPGATNTVYKVRVTPQDNDLVNAVANYQEIEVQSATTAVQHQPGTIYEGGSGFAGQVLLVNDFTHASYQRADASDSVGYVTAVKITFPAACTNIRIDANVDNNYIYTDGAITDTHRIFIFPQTHFTNQMSGPVKAFRYYVSNMYGCVTDANADISVTTSNEYLTVDTLSANAASTPQNITLNSMWPIGGAYPPTDYAEQHIVWFDQLIQGATHLGPSVALSAPVIGFTTAPCNVYVSISGEVDAGGNGYSPGWGYMTTYDANLSMTDIFSNPGTSNLGSAFVFRALEWLNHIGVSIRYSVADANCQIVQASGTISYIKLNPSYTLTTAVNPV